REWGLELAQIAAVAKSSPWQLVGDLVAPGPMNTNVTVVGHSFGGMAAVLAGSVSGDIDLLAVNAASADLSLMFEPVLNEGIRDQLIAAGVDLNTPSGQARLADELATTIPVFDWVM